ncbi:MAG: S41 family peptidase [Saprospiraceae bacterium]
MSAIILTFVLLIPLTGLAQPCNCETEFDAVQQYFEANHPGFQTNFTGKKLVVYKAEVAKLKKAVASKRLKEDCLVYLSKYTDLLQDHHIGISSNISGLKRLDLSAPEALDRFKNSAAYLAKESISIDTAQLIAYLASPKASMVEGIYTNGRLQIAVLKNKTKTRDFVGIAIRTASKLVNDGHVVLELKRISGDKYFVKYHLTGFDPAVITMVSDLKNGEIPQIGYAKVQAQSPKSTPFEFRELDAQTNYVRLSSFEGALYNDYETFYESISGRITDKPWLIVDLRDNGGGSEQCYYGLMPFLYSRPMMLDTSEIWVSPDNIRRYEEALARQEQDSASYGAATLSGTRRTLAKMKAAKPFSLVLETEDYPSEPWTYDSVTTYPRKVAILFNRGTASAAEGLIYYARQSDKVVTIGENSGGYLGFGNAMTTTTPCGGYTIACTTVKYRTKSKNEFIGFPPQYRAPAQGDWVDFAKEVLKGK